MNNYKEFVEKHKYEMLSLLSSLVKVPSVMGTAEANFPFGKQTAKALEITLKRAEEMGFTVHNAENYYGTVDFLPDNVSEPQLAILCHLDVVPEGNGWTYNPFEVTESDGILYGRGVTDDKGPATSALYALYCIKESGIKLSKGIRLIFGTNEENGSADIEYYLKHDKMPKMVFTPDASYPLINCEKGMSRTEYTAKINNSDIIEINGGQVINAVPAQCYAILSHKYEKEICSYIRKDVNECEFSVEHVGNNIKVVCKGESAHASTPEKGKNSIIAILEMLTTLDIDSDTKTLLSSILRLYPYGETDGSSLGIACKDESGALTCVLSLIHAQNGKITYSTDTRFPISMTTVQLKKMLEKSIENTGILMSDFMGTDAHYASPDSFLVKALLNVYEEHTAKKGECVAIGGGTYVHGIEGGVAFGVEHTDTDYRIHGADEFVPVCELLDNTVIFAKAIEKLCK